MATLTAILAILVVVAILFEVARKVGVPYPTLFVLGGLALAFVPGLPTLTLEPDLVLLVFLPPLLFRAAFETPARDLRLNLWPISRLAIGLVVVSIGVVGVAVHAAVPAMGWAAAFALGAIVAPTDALAATSVFGRIGVPRIVVTLIEGESLFNDASALVAYRAAVVAAISGTFVLTAALGDFAVAAVGGVAIGLVAGLLAVELLRIIDDPPVEVAISLVIPFAAYLPSAAIGVSGVLASVVAGLVVGRRLGTVLSADSRVLWLTTWKMIAFILNGFAFVLIGLQLREILAGAGSIPPATVVSLILLVSAIVIVTRLVFVFGSSFLPNSPRRRVADRDPALAWRLTFLVGWAGLRGAVSLAAALALPAAVPERDLILLVTFGVILVTLVGQGLTLPLVVRRLGWDGVEPEGDEGTAARAVAYHAGLAEVRRARAEWPDHAPLFDRLQASLEDRSRHLATADPEETDERRQERREHEAIQRAVIAAERRAVIELRDRGVINDQTLREVERELDLEELRMEA